MLAPGTVVPPGRLIPAKQLWAGNPAEYVKELNVAECWSNYSLSYLHLNLANMHVNEFTPHQSGYLEKDATVEDLEIDDQSSHAQ